jgi:hypothetical protein
VTARRVPDWMVERLHAGDLPPDEAARVRAALDAEGGLFRLERLAEDDRAFAAAHPPGPALGKIRLLRQAQDVRKAQAERALRSRRRLLVLVPALASAAAALLLAVQLGAPGLLGMQPQDGLRMKGDARLTVHRQGPVVDAEPLADGARARPGDVVQLAYVAAGRRYGVVISVDGRGLVTQHLPEDGADAVPLQGGGAVALPHAYALDDAPAFERFFLVTSDAPFRAEPALAAARALAAKGHARSGALELPRGFEAASFLLQKVDR